MSEDWDKCDACGKETWQWVDEDGSFTCKSCGADNCHPWDDEISVLESPSITDEEH